jgi:GrpB-like predicted nucleotidyltransferase (UPF0157 family)
VIDYDPAWIGRYVTEAHRLREALGPGPAAIEHVGSTSIPGMAAKPIIDILAAQPQAHSLDVIVHRLSGIGYLYTPESEVDDPDRRVFRKGPADMRLMRTHHLHLTDIGGQYWRRILAFRDWLRTHHEDADTYAQLKRDLVTRHGRDSHVYTNAKHEFVTDIELRAGIPHPRDCPYCYGQSL